MTKEHGGDPPVGGAPTPDPPSPMVERRKKPMVHPAAPAPLPKDYGETPPHPKTPPSSSQVSPGDPIGTHPKKKKAGGGGTLGGDPSGDSLMADIGLSNGGDLTLPSPPQPRGTGTLPREQGTPWGQGLPTPQKKACMGEGPKWEFGGSLMPAMGLYIAWCPPPLWTVTPPHGDRVTPPPLCHRDSLHGR